MEPVFETNCVITGPHGQEFRANGAMFDPDRGGCLYAAWNHDGLSGPLETWHGEYVGTYWVTSAWRRYTNYGWLNMNAITATIGGKEFYGRYSPDTGQLVRLKPRKSA